MSDRRRERNSYNKCVKNTINCMLNCSAHDYLLAVNQFRIMFLQNRKNFILLLPGE